MVCEHLRVLEQELVARGIKETFRGQAWSKNSREWVYFACYLDRAMLRQRFSFAESVKEWEHLGTHDGQEVGFVCTACQDGIMGVHERHRQGLPIIR